MPPPIAQRRLPPGSIAPVWNALLPSSFLGARSTKLGEFRLDLIIGGHGKGFGAEVDHGFVAEVTERSDLSGIGCNYLDASLADDFQRIRVILSRPFNEALGMPGADFSKSLLERLG